MAVLVVVGFTLSNSGSRLAAVGIAVTGFCSIVFIAAYRVRLAHEVGTASIARWRWPSLGVTVALVVAGVFVPQAIAVDSPPHEESSPAGPIIVGSSDDGAASYLAADKTVVIGINGNLPGWSLESNGTYSGFDVDLANFLKQKYGFTLRFKKLTQQERQKQWDGVTKDPADLVISAFSITEDRRAAFGMAGPYYIDMSTMLISGPKPEEVNGKSYGCAVPGTTGYTAMVNLKTRKEREFRTPLVIDESQIDLAGCLAKFFAIDDDTAFIFSDWSIIRASKPEVSIVRYEDKSPLLDIGPASSSSSTERYGIAFRPGHPQLCRDLTKAIDEFIAGGGASAWTKAYNANLKDRSVLNTDDWHHPKVTEERFCGLPGPGGSD
ncbi:substrate-binding periplasmic protein [Actinokineospora cianjurensis]|uniref:substrate-binding periplasmic protein n=1 Tax=Actinokineospora cianjurensis TaxID=585224 RepID=UPI001477362D|nr:transporter substrate-binding domain-containing protein [Actinokineospora cianjurensis]